MTHAVETMAYANAVPWHGLGVPVSDDLTTDEMLVAAGLDWGVTQHPLFADVNGERVETNRYGLVRSTDNKVLTVTSKKWTPFQNRDALDFFKSYTKAGGAKLETAGSLRGGRVIWGLANIGSNFSVSRGDDVNGYILLVSPHEVGFSINVKTTPVRVVCANTLAMAERGVSSYRQSHVKMFDTDAARATVELARENMYQAQVDSIKLKALQLSDSDVVRILAETFQTAPRDADKKELKAHYKELGDVPDSYNRTMTKIMGAYTAAPGADPGNAWGAINAVTYWTDHEAGRSQDQRMYNSWIGYNAQVKNAVHKKLLEMAD